MDKTKAKICRNKLEFIFLLPKYPPRTPPITTIHIKITEEMGTVPPCKTKPNKPAIEFTKINNAEIAAVCFIVAHPKSSNIGLKMIPPPIPINPDKNPITAPIQSAKGIFSGFIVVLSFPKKPANLNTAISNTVPKIIL